jgi:hypothetical protein
MVSLDFSSTKFFRSHYGPGVDSASNRNEYQENFLGVNAAGAVVMKSGSLNFLEPSGPLQACNGTALPFRCTNFSKFLFCTETTCFGEFLCPSSGIFHCTHSDGICHAGLLTACEQDQDRPCSQAVSIPVWHIPLLCVQWKTPDDGQRNWPKHVEFHYKSKLEKLVHLDGFIMRNVSRCRSHEGQISFKLTNCWDTSVVLCSCVEIRRYGSRNTLLYAVLQHSSPLV